MLSSQLPLSREKSEILGFLEEMVEFSEQAFPGDERSIKTLEFASLRNVGRLLSLIRPTTRQTNFHLFRRNPWQIFHMLETAYVNHFGATNLAVWKRRYAAAQRSTLSPSLFKNLLAATDTKIVLGPMYYRNDLLHFFSTLGGRELLEHSNGRRVVIFLAAAQHELFQNMLNKKVSALDVRVFNPRFFCRSSKLSWTKELQEKLRFLAFFQKHPAAREIIPALQRGATESLGFWEFLDSFEDLGSCSKAFVPSVVHPFSLVFLQHLHTKKTPAVVLPNLLEQLTVAAFMESAAARGNLPFRVFCAESCQVFDDTLKQAFETLFGQSCQVLSIPGDQHKTGSGNIYLLASQPHAEAIRYAELVCQTFVEQRASGATNATLVIRPHPMEGSLGYRLALRKYLQPGVVELSNNMPFDELLQATSVVLSKNSTVLYEAMRRGKHCVVLALGDALENYPFEVFADQMTWVRNEAELSTFWWSLENQSESPRRIRSHYPS